MRNRFPIEGCLVKSVEVSDNSPNQRFEVLKDKVVYAPRNGKRYSWENFQQFIYDDRGFIAMYVKAV